MKIQFADPTQGTGDGRFYSVSMIVDDSLAIDAGGIGLLPLKCQRRIEHVVLTHSHLDHIATLPLFLDNVYEPSEKCPTIYGHAAVWDCLRDDFFNERVWPDLVRVSKEETPFFRSVTLVDGEPTEIGELKITPLALQHSVPTLGLVVESPTAAIATVWDTAPTDKIWEVINSTEKLKAVFLEASFPNSMDWLARKAGHLTPEMFRVELRKLRRHVPVFAMHMKPVFHDAIVSELTALNAPDLAIGQPGLVYEF